MSSEDELPPYLVPHSQEPIRILYADADLLLVRKPHLLLSVPGRHPLNRDCLISRLQQDYPQASMVHRLDLDTSGIMVVPLNRACGVRRSCSRRAAAWPGVLVPARRARLAGRSMRSTSG